MSYVVSKGGDLVFCMKCGTKLPDEAKYCFRCGANLDSMSQNLSPNTTQYSQVNNRSVHNNDVYYEREWGLIYKNRVKLTSSSFEFNGKSIPISEINQVQWGVMKVKRGGIPTNTDYCITVCSDNQTLFVSPNKKEIYYELTQKLWKAVAGQIVIKILTSLRNGQDAGFGEKLQDRGIHYKQHNWFSKDVDRFYTWNEITLDYDNGDLIFLNSENDVLARYSFLFSFNVPMLEAIVNSAKKKRLVRLSDLM